jgi:hypothetical protein
LANSYGSGAVCLAAHLVVDEGRRLVGAIGTAGKSQVRVVKQIAARRDSDASNGIRAAAEAKRVALRIGCHLGLLLVSFGRQSPTHKLGHAGAPLAVSECWPPWTQ